MLRPLLVVFTAFFLQKGATPFELGPAASLRARAASNKHGSVLFSAHQSSPTKRQRIPCFDPEVFEENLSKLEKYRQTHGHADVPRTYEDDKQLSNWVINIRRQALRLTEHQRARLEELGFEPKPNRVRARRNQQTWSEMHEKLSSYQKIHGDCLVSSTFEDKQLCIWVGNQRALYSRGELKTDRITRLEALGFEWRIRKRVPRPKRTWSGMYEELCSYQQIHGNCLVPRVCQENPGLANWVVNQRRFFKQNSLAEERIQKLNDIGFEWDGHAGKWQTMLERLRVFKAEHGHCVVKTETDSRLGGWVTFQRKKYKAGSLGKDKIQMLDSIGFEWEGASAPVWGRMYEKLCVYRKEHGNCLVPRGYTDTKFANWVRSMRNKFRQNKLDEEQVSLLEAVGFEKDARANQLIGHKIHLQREAAKS